MVMPDLAERLRRALADADSPPWLPELTEDLVSSGWRALYRKCGLSPGSYSTERVIAGNINAPLNSVAFLVTHSSNGDANESIQINLLDKSYAKPYEDSGVRFYTEGEIRSGSVVSCVKDALEVLARVPTLAATVVSLVRSLHLIKPEHDDYDVSFSEPDVPFSIFVSVPQGNSPTNTLRVAEAIVHEAMHLQLTLIERIVPLVSSTGGEYFSPWRGGFRNAQGVLHGLYVFSVIDRFLNALRALPLKGTASVGYIGGRRSEIHTQIRLINSFQEAEDLTEVGRMFIRRLVASI